MELGFRFGDRDYEHAPGLSRLEINLYAQPTEELFTFVIQEIDILKKKNRWPDRVPALELLI